MKKYTLALFIVLLATLLVACGGDGSSDSKGKDSTDKDKKTELKVAIDAPPPTLDMPTSTATSTRDAARFIFETLVTTDSNFKPVPMLAESIDTEDNKTYTFKLREGVKFHNGEEMKAEDVIASMERWMELSTITGNVFNDAKWSEVDEYTVELELAQASSLTLDTLASAKMGAAIMPKELAENAPAEGVSEYIGTGPYKFVEWKQDQYIHYTKYDDYQALDTPADGLSGKKEALIDDIYLYIVTDTSTRVAGLQTGEYDYAYGIPYDSYEQIENDDNLESILTPSANQMAGINGREGLTADPKIRQAINMAIDNEEVMFGAFPRDEFFWLDSGYMDENIVNWYTEAGKEYYNQADPEGAKKLLDEAGYNGEELTFLATRDYDHHYNTSVVLTEQLKKAGFNVKLEIYDWPTVLDIQGNQPTEWDMYMTSASTVSTPPQLIGLNKRWAGGAYDEVQDLITAIETAPTHEEAFKHWEELQLFLYEEVVPIIHLGGYNSLSAHNKKVEGIEMLTGPIFWNATISE